MEPWTIRQALAWLRWQNQERVERYGSADAARNAMADRMYPVHSGLPERLSQADAEAQMLAALRSGAIEAYGPAGAYSQAFWMFRTLAKFDGEVLDGIRVWRERIVATSNSTSVNEKSCELKVTSRPDIIRKAIAEVYDHADRFTMRPPNINELPKIVNEVLAYTGQTATGAKIKELAGASEFQKRRVRPGCRPSLSAFSLQGYTKSGLKS